jgi:RNA polymerase sigma-70 factor (ECF subfamily)
MANSAEAGETSQEPGAEPSDHSLLRRFRRGSEDAATQLYLRYAQRLRAWAEARCSPELAQQVGVEDIVQSVFGSFFREARQGYYNVPAGEELWRLLLVLALNKIRAKGRYHHAAKRDLRLTAGGGSLDQVPSTKTQDDAEYAFLQLAVAEALERLPPRHKRVVELRLEGYEVAEIATLSGRSKRTVERFLQAARQKLGDLLQEGQ